MTSRFSPGTATTLHPGLAGKWATSIPRRLPRGPPPAGSDTAGLAYRRPATKEEVSRLVRLADDVPVALDWEGWKLQQPDLERFLALCQEWGFHSLANQARSARPVAVAAAADRPAQRELFPAPAPEDRSAEGGPSVNGENGPPPPASGG